MIVASIDIMGGNAVQLVGGKEKALDAGSPIAVAERFGVSGELAVIDLDAALGTGSNEAVISELTKRVRCRVGGGIRDLDTAVRWLDAGAEKIILGTKAVPELLSKLPRERLIAAVDAVDDDVVVEGWQTKTGVSIAARIEELREYVGGFLVTFVEKEGRLGGTRLDRAAELVSLAGDARVTVAGGITTAEDIAELDKLGADAQVGMALYTEQLHLADAIAAPLASDRPDGLWPTVVCDEHGKALGLAWSDRESLREAVSTRKGVYHSRRRGLWRKGETSGSTQELIEVLPDCDRDALRFTVRQHGEGFCHLQTRSCWGEVPGLDRLYRRLLERSQTAPPGSYTKRLLTDRALLEAKLREEAEELAQAGTPDEIRGEAADLLYFTLTKMAAAGVTLEEVEAELELRSRKISRRSGDAKPGSSKESE